MLLLLLALLIRCGNARSQGWLTLVSILNEEMNMAILDAMLNSLRYGSSVQKEVREFIEGEDGRLKEGIASAVARVCANFKRDSELEISILSIEDKKDYRKRTNNIINDVSRICREMLGFSIVNTKRSKRVYEYAAVRYDKEAEKIIKIIKELGDPVDYTAISSPVVNCIREHFDSSKHCVKPDPEKVEEFFPLFGREGDPAYDCYVWTSWTPEVFVSKMDAAGVDLEAVAKLILDRLRSRRVAA